MKISVAKRVVENESGQTIYWVTRWKPPGEKAKRRFFKTQKEALDEKKAVEEQVRSRGEDFMLMDSKKRFELMGDVATAEKAGFTVRQAVEAYLKVYQRTDGALAGDVWKDFWKEKGSNTWTKSKTKQALKSNVGRFIAGREQVPINQITPEDVVAYFRRPEYSPVTQNTYLTSVHTFFNWCVENGRLSISPTKKLKKIPRSKLGNVDDEPTVLTIEQCTNLLRAALDYDRGMVGYIAVGMFAGLRPQKEAGCLLRVDIDDDHILVRGSNAKDGQRRYVDVHPTLREWLKVRSEFPPERLRRRFEIVRAKAGLITLTKKDGCEKEQIEWTGWDQYCLRHTFASYYLAIHGAEKTIAQLGHGDYSMIFTHYRKLVKREEAEKFWALTPTVIDPKTFVGYKHGAEVAAQAGDKSVNSNGADAAVGAVAGQVESDAHPESNAHGAAPSLLKEAQPWVSEDRPVTED